MFLERITKFTPRKIRTYHRSKFSMPETGFNEVGTNKFHFTLSSLSVRSDRPA